jgi:deoxyribodipyrimidine photo-lyase
MTANKTIFWFRRDLRLDDNAGLYHALKSGNSVQPIFIFDRLILDKLADKSDARVQFIHNEITRLQKELKAFGSSMDVYYDTPKNIFSQLSNDNSIKAVYTNHDYEPYAKQRDQEIEKLLALANIEFNTSKDHSLFEKEEVLKSDGTPYLVFTPYSKIWKQKMDEFYSKSYPTEKYYEAFVQRSSSKIISLEEMGFIPNTDLTFPDRIAQKNILANYNETRDFPANEQSTSKLGVHLRFGTISIRSLARKAMQLNDTYLNELIWRDFYSMILWHYPHSAENSFRPKYDQIQWDNNETHFKAWCQGKTGYPMVDAGMRELNETGYMHNRVRMVVASFLTKHLLIDWRWGAAYFAEKLLDFDLSANAGGWQWAAGSGTDAAPYFRIFNPESQLKKFDKDLKYVKKWVPEIEDPFEYAQPIVEHKFARERCLRVFKETLKPE